MAAMSMSFLLSWKIRKTASNISEVQARGAEVILITDESEKDCMVTAEITVAVPETLKEFQNSLLVLPLQLLSYYTAKNLGCDIDRPKNLAKSVWLGGKILRWRENLCRFCEKIECCRWKSHLFSSINLVLARKITSTWRGKVCVPKQK